MATATAPEREARPEKTAVVARVSAELADNPATLFTDYRGLSVPELAELRAKLREAGARYVVAKNTLVAIAVREAGFEGLEDVLIGPTALTFCREDPVAPAKAIRSFAKDHPELVVKGAILEGRFVDAETANKLADLESREDLIQKLAGLMYAALSGAASLLQAPLSQMARLVAALHDKGEGPEGEAPPEPAEEPEVEAAAAEPAEEAEVEAPEAAVAEEAEPEVVAEAEAEAAPEAESAAEPEAEAAEEAGSEEAEAEAAESPEAEGEDAPEEAETAATPEAEAAEEPAATAEPETDDDQAVRPQSH